ncbi:DUF3168 domain-containing protein [Roseovarius gahaiensis]|uniref:DUF3168 domain-containing protein n=1 Tax=Roseovarius gahaiensis TaxID=2716691 RepID=A0A967EDT2_9RHOB|nr:DUF3168 domain-containing protein [Roseovarius gahaiensis]NHQ73458.1 DUF3168 domain-containing protein [Roseovarius gahaiensis]
MSYAAAAALQEAVFQRLASDTDLAALVGGAIYDTVPAGSLPETYVTLGPEDVRARSDGSGGGAWHRFAVSVITSAAGFHAAKQVAATISEALTDADLPLGHGHLVALHFYRARARREGTGAQRRIDLTFRARTQDTL